jgi:hypothetical protein
MSPDQQSSSSQPPDSEASRPSEQGWTSPSEQVPVEKHYIYKINPGTNQVISAEELDPVTGERKEVPMNYYGSRVQGGGGGFAPSAASYGAYSYDPYGYYGYGYHPGLTVQAGTSPFNVSPLVPYPCTPVWSGIPNFPLPPCAPLPAAPPPCVPQAPPCVPQAPPCVPQAPPCMPQAPPCVPQAPPCMPQAPPCVPQAPPCVPQAPPCVALQPLGGVAAPQAAAIPLPWSGPCLSPSPCFVLFSPCPRCNA